MSHKYQVVLPDPIAEQLEELAAGAGERPSTLAGQLIRHGIAQAANDGKIRPLRQAPVIVGTAKNSERARWLEPYGGDPDWRTEMWGQIVALHGRYPDHLQHLKDGWWTSEHHIETLSALATWRAEIDDTGIDPRDELAFQTQLTDYSQTLKQESAGVTKAWKPGAPPTEWAAK